MVILTLAGLLLIGYGIILFIRGFIKLFKALFYMTLASEKQIDEGYKKHVVKETKEYKDFEKGFDDEIDGILNPKSFKL